VQNRENWREPTDMPTYIFFASLDHLCGCMGGLVTLHCYIYITNPRWPPLPYWIYDANNFGLDGLCRRKRGAI